MSQSKLIFQGSSGCIFRPQIPCNGSKSKKTKNKVTKVIFDKKNKEYKIGNFIKKIHNYQKWTTLWEDICDSPDYEKLTKHTDINLCLKNNNMDPNNIPKNFKFLLFQGSHGGLTLENYCKKTITKEMLKNKKKFIILFKRMFKLLNNVFYGLVELSKNNICHQDINIRNILIKDKKSYIIDYDISLFIDDKLEKNDFLLKRIKSEYDNYRLYEAYPFEYLYSILDDEDIILNEQENIALYQNRINYYEIYDPIYHKIFSIDTDNLRFEFLEDKLQGINKQNFNDLFKSLDTYSLGMMIFIIFLDSSERLEVSQETVIQNLRCDELRPYLSLIRDMIEFDYRDRPHIREIYKRYLNLI